MKKPVKIHVPHWVITTLCILLLAGTIINVGYVIFQNKDNLEQITVRYFLILLPELYIISIFGIASLLKKYFVFKV